MKNSATVRIDAAYFETEEGEQFLDKYTAWKNGNAVSEDIKRRREKLAAAGLASAGSKMSGKVTDYIKRVLEESGEGMTAAQVTTAVNEVLKTEGKGETANASGVALSLRKHCTAFSTREGEGKDATYTFKAEKPAKKKAA